MALGDFKGDGLLDVATANYGSGMVSVLLKYCVAPGPSLMVTHRETNATVSWPFPSNGFALESTTNVVAKNWLPAVEPASTNGGRWEITAPLVSP